MPVRTLGWPYPFNARPWVDIVKQFQEMAERHDEFRHMADIVRSVYTSGVDDQLAACTSMHDLLVVTRPVPDLPYDLVAVRSPSSLRPVADGHVLIEHLAVTGRNDRISCPVANAVPLFWRFMDLKFGVRQSA
jgi:hypothetical protein